MKKAFTLAEVLITLGIIGIVAALTIPSLISSYQKQQTVNRLKLVYSQLFQGIKMSEAQNGFISDWNFVEGAGYKSFEEYILPFMKNVKVFDMKTNGSLGVTYLELSGQPEVGLGMMRDLYQSKIYTLSNGTQLFLPVKAGGVGGYQIIVDINGFKAPNQFGKDVFDFVISKRGLSPAGYYSTAECTVPGGQAPTRAFLMSTNSCTQNYACNKNSRGMWCSSLIIMDGWQIKSDYPW